MTMIKKIARIVKFGSFDGFVWDSSVRNEDGKPAEFKKVNILYGRNYSGKTTLSRIFQALEKGKLPEPRSGCELPGQYSGVDFTLVDCDNNTISADTLDGYADKVRVFNSDFVKENLQFIYGDADEGINSFAILGEENADVDKQIANAESELGSVDRESGLLWKEKLAGDALNAANDKHADAESKFTEAKQVPAEKIRGDSSKYGREGKYIVTSLPSDIKTIDLASYPPLDSDELKTYEARTNDEEKLRIELPEELKVNFDDLVDKAKSLVERNVERQEPIHELLSNPDLEEWVSAGIDLHKDRGECGYCRRRLTNKILTRLKNHFNQSTKELQNEIESLLIELGKEDAAVQNPLEKSEFDNAKFYSDFHDELDDARSTYTSEAKKHQSAIGELKEQLEKKSRAVSSVLIFKSPDFDVSQLREVDERLRKIIADSNAYKDKLVNAKKEAQDLLRKDLIANWMIAIGYDAKESEIKQLDTAKEKAKGDLDDAQKLVAEKQHEVKRLKESLKDETAGARKVNQFLSSHFAQHSFSLVPVESASQGDGENDPASQHRFVIKRGGEIAHNLSEGELNIIAFCYFVARLHDGNPKKPYPIIWIDDPVSSLDANHIFLAFSLIRTEILNFCNQEQARKQVFVSTHNLDFLKYLMSIKYYLRKLKLEKEIEFFFVERPRAISTVTKMPEHLKRATEFNYLFKQIHACAFGKVADGDAYQTSQVFGNSTRQFLEVFLYYRYPNTNPFSERLSKFFEPGEEAMEAATNRLINESSHMGEQVDRGERLPIPPTAEAKLVARHLLKKIYKHDRIQYKELWKSIRKKPVRRTQ